MSQLWKSKFQGNNNERAKNSWGFSSTLSRGTKVQQNPTKSTKQSVNKNNHSIFLTTNSSKFNVFKSMPFFLTITTKNSSGQFNINLLDNISSVISNFLKQKPKELNYKIDIDDELNVMQKIEKIYKGETVNFTDEEIEKSRQIFDELNIKLYPNSLNNANGNKNVWFSSVKSPGVTIDFSQNLLIHIRARAFETFSIFTKKKEYKCNVFGVLSSSVIREFILKNPNVDTYIYEIDDENGDFQSIEKFFNFNETELSNKNVFTIKEIFEDLGIDYAINNIDEFIENIEKVSQMIDDQQDIVETIDDLFDLLIHIKEKTVDYAINYIKESIWSKTEDSIIELTAFLLQVILKNIQLHPYLIELIEKLNDEKEEKYKLLLPTLKKNLLISEKRDKYGAGTVFSFFYQMYKKGFIKLEEIEGNIRYCNIEFNSWFLPELTNINSNNLRKLIYPAGYVQIEEFIEMRDKGECQNEIAIALKNDDIDKFQAIISSSKEKILKEKIIFNIFEPFLKQDTRFLNYAAAYGSIKCFKYLLLNDEKIDKYTFEMAIIGGNNEIIRIVDNQNKNEYYKNELLLITIGRHQNDLFDWLFEKNLSMLDQSDLLSLMDYSLKNGNAHSAIQIIDSGFNFQKISNNYPNFLTLTTERGFYLLSSFLINLIRKNYSQKFFNNIYSFVCFDNISIFQLFEKEASQEDLNAALLQSVNAKSMRIIKYYFEKLVADHKFELNPHNCRSIILATIHHYFDEVFDYLIEKINVLCPFNLKALLELLNESYKSMNEKSSKKILDLIYSSNPNNSLTNEFLQAAKLNLKTILNYFIEKKYKIDFGELSHKLMQIGTLNIDVFLIIINNMSPYFQKLVMRCINVVIKENNISLAQYIIDNDGLLENSLIEAVKVDNIDIVKMIIKKNSSPSFINQRIANETALTISIDRNNKEIFDVLISLPGIDLNVYVDNFNTPLIKSVMAFNEYMFNSILKLYGEGIKDQKWQIEKALDFIIGRSSYLRKSTSKIIFHKLIDLNIVDPNTRFLKNTLLNCACENNTIDIVEKLIKSDSTDVNITESEYNNSPLITSIVNKNVQIAKLLINHPKIDLNLKNCDGNSALDIAVELNLKSIANLILNNEKFDKNERNLNKAFYMANAEISKQFFEIHNFDVNYIPPIIMSKDIYIKIGGTIILKTKLIQSIIQNDEKLFDLVVQHPSFEIIQEQMYNALYVAIRERQINFLKKLTKMSDDIDINSRKIDNSSLLLFAVKLNLKQEFISCIINYPKFDSKQSDILQAFMLAITSVSNYSKDIINLLYDYDCKHYHLIDDEIKKEGSALLTSTLRIPSENGIEFLINHGVDPNKPDQKGIYPLKIAINVFPDNITLCLLNSKLIDLNKLMPNTNKYSEANYTTYLHIITGLNKSFLLRKIIDNKLCDINITNDLGETALMDACKYQRIECVKIFFKSNDLDFNHRNNKGEDAIEMVRNIMNKKNDEENNKIIKDKKKYLGKLLVLLDEYKKESNGVFKGLRLNKLNNLFFLNENETNPAKPKDEPLEVKPSTQKIDNSNEQKDDSNKMKQSNQKDDSVEIKSSIQKVGDANEQKEESNKMKQFTQKVDNSNEQKGEPVEVKSKSFVPFSTKPKDTDKSISLFTNSKTGWKNDDNKSTTFSTKKVENKNKNTPYYAHFSSNQNLEELVQEHNKSFSKPPNQKTKRKFDIYNESFTEKPDESFQRMINELKQKNSANENSTTQNDPTKTKH